MEEHIVGTIESICNSGIAWLRHVVDNGKYGPKETVLATMARAIETDDLDEIFPIENVSGLCCIL